MNHPRALPWIVGVGIVAISTAAIFIKLSHDAQPVIIAATRMVLATLCLVPPAIAAHRRRALTLPRKHVRAVIFAGLFLGLHFYFWVASLRHTSVLSSVVLVTTNPIFVGIASFVFLKEKLHRNLIIAIVMAVVGGTLIGLSDAAGSAEVSARIPSASGATPIDAGVVEADGTKAAPIVKPGPTEKPGALYGNFLSLAGAVMASCYLLIGRRVRAEVELLPYVLPVYGVAALLLAAISLAQGATVLGLNRATYVYLILLALVPQLIGHTSLNYALRHLPATLVAVCILGEPIGATLFAYFFLGEAIRLMQGIGGGIILLGIFVASRVPTTTPAAGSLRRGDSRPKPQA
ncbi:MAG: DMT family transporter [Planctomycetia bacterium]|nr:MAG: DMT family transporter [Planctomycetia bacterium]